MPDDGGYAGPRGRYRARVEGLTLVTADTWLSAYDVPILPAES